MAVNNYGWDAYLPKLVRAINGLGSPRTEMQFTMKNSATFYLGQFVTLINGTEAAPTSNSENGLNGYTANEPVVGYVVGFVTKNGGQVPIQDDTGRAGTLTDTVAPTAGAPTTFVPMKYQASATNDRSSANPALEKVIVMPIFPGDVLAVPLTTSGGLITPRGTTVAQGTTNSSANPNIGIKINGTYPWSLLESSANTSLLTRDFLTTEVDGNLPLNANMVYVTPIRPFFGSKIGNNI